MYIALQTVCGTDGQSIAIRLNKQLRKASHAIRKCVTAYNSVQGFNAAAGATVPETICEKDVSSYYSLFAAVLNITQVVSHPVSAKIYLNI